MTILNVLCWQMFFLLFLTENSLQAERVNIHTQSVVNTVDDMFVGVCFDSSKIRSGFSFGSASLMLLTKALTPSYLRVGGTDADYLVFSPGTPRQHHSGRRKPFTMNDALWDELNEFVKQTGVKLIFGLNVNLRKNGRWDPTNAKLLLNYSAHKGYPIAGFELGNEQNLAHNINGSDLGADVRELKQVLQHSYYSSSMVLGPDTAGWRDTYIKNFIASSDHDVDVITFHHYYMDGHTATVNDFFNVSRLDSATREFQKAATRGNSYHPKKPVWLGETSSAYGGGVVGVSDTFAAGFMWLDKLGLSARYGLKGVMRQSLIGGHYGLIQDNMQPNPDFWLTLYFKKLVGNYVFAATASSKTLRVYAHCTKQPNNYNYKPGSLTLYVMNLGDKSAWMELGNFANDRATNHFDSFIFTSNHNGLSKDVYLNGHHMVVRNNQLPHVNPHRKSGHQMMPAKSYGFYVIPSANIAPCKANTNPVIIG